MRESPIQQDIVSMLSLHHRVAWCMVITTGKFKVKGGYIVTGHYIDEDQKRRTGMSDIIGQLRDGRIFVIETKRPGNTPEDHQAEFIEMVKQNRGVAGWADNVETAKWIIDNA